MSFRSLNDILNEIEEDVSDEEGDFEQIEYVENVKKPLLDIPEEYTRLNGPRIHNQIQYYEEYNYKKENKVLPLTESNLAKVNNEPLISYGVVGRSIEEDAKSRMSKKSHKSELSKKSSKSSRSQVSNIDFSVGDDRDERFSVKSQRDDSMSVISSISSVSMGSVKSRVSVNEKRGVSPSPVKREPYKEPPKANSINITPVSHRKNWDEMSEISRTSKISKASKMTEKSYSKQAIPLSESIFPKANKLKSVNEMENKMYGFDKFANVKKEEEKKVDIKKMKNIDEFREKVQRYIQLDNEVKELIKAMRERNSEKRKLESLILEFMKENEIGTVKNKADNRMIEYYERRRPESVTKDYMKEKLLELLKDGNASEKIVEYMYSNRKEYVKEGIKMVKDGEGKKKKKY